MKNQLWHFGDSFAACDVEREDIFSKYISEYFNFDLKHCAKGGSSNFGIFNEILKNISDFKSGDRLLINWSYLDRSQFFEKERNSSKQEWIDTSRFIGENAFGGKIPKGDMWYDYMQEKMSFLNHWLDNTFNENVLLFNYILFNFFNSLTFKGIISYHLFINKNVELYQEGKVSGLASNIIIPFQNEINFEPSYFDWLVSNGYKTEESVHYKFGIQKILADKILEQIKLVESKNIF